MFKRLLERRSRRTEIVDLFRIEYFKDYQAIKRSYPCMTDREMSKIAWRFINNV